MLDDHRGPAEPFGHVSLAQLPVRDDVVVPVDLGRIGFHSLDRVEHRRKLFVIYLDELQSISGYLQAFRGNERDGLPVVAHPLLREHLVPGLQESDLRGLPHHILDVLVVGHVGGSQNTGHAL